MAFPASPVEWVERLHGVLRERQPECELFQRYADGAHDYPTVEEKASRAFRRILGLSITNLSGLIVEATAERMQVQGFRFGDDPGGDADAWRIWQSSDFDAESELCVGSALTVGRSFVLVEPPRGVGELPRLYAEDAGQVVVAYAPGRRDERLAALKVWADEWSGDTFATLYLPGSLHKFRARQSSMPTLPSQVGGRRVDVAVGPVRWEFRVPEVEGERNPFGEVPVFELRNRPRLDGSVRSEIADVLPDQDRANHIALNALIAAEYGAFRQKWATGLEVPRDENGRAVEPFNVAVNRILISESEGAKFGDFNATDLQPYIALYESTVKHMAAVSQTPVSVLLGTPSNVSAEALALSITGLVNKVRRRMTHFEQPFEGALRCAFRLMGDPRGGAVSAETVWADPDIKSWSQMADAAQKLVTSNVVTPQTAQEMFLGMTDVQRQRDDVWRGENDTLGAFGAMLAGQAGPVPEQIGEQV